MVRNEVTAKIVRDSENHLQTRLTTIQVRVPKFLLQEINTHRVFSRSYNSSRAIPAKVMRQSADFKPDAWLSNKPGMQGGEELTGWRRYLAIATWQILTALIKLGHRILQFAGLHKQYTNRWLEPIVWADGVISSTDWANFLKLRNHPDAQPEIHQLAMLIERELANNRPDFLNPGEWHLPYIDSEEMTEYDNETLCLISAARCARVSYGFTGKKDLAADLKRASMLIVSEPAHLSPFEHVAQCPFGMNEFKSGNFRNWTQFRKILEFGIG